MAPVDGYLQEKVLCEYFTDNLIFFFVSLHTVLRTLGKIHVKICDLTGGFGGNYWTTVVIFALPVLCTCSISESTWMTSKLIQWNNIMVITAN